MTRAIPFKADAVNEPENQNLSPDQSCKRQSSYFHKLQLHIKLDQTRIKYLVNLLMQCAIRGQNVYTRILRIK